MSPHLAKPDAGSGSSSSAESSIGSIDSKYDLYAVCYHQGNTLETGHYTAACLNPYDQQWYRFDDQRVSQVPKERVDEEIINEEAYMLFYQKRKMDSDGSECSGSSTGSSGDHWISKIAPSGLPMPKVDNREMVSPVGADESVLNEVIREESPVPRGEQPIEPISCESDPRECEMKKHEHEDVVVNVTAAEQNEEATCGPERVSDAIIMTADTYCPDASKVTEIVEVYKGSPELRIVEEEILETPIGASIEIDAVVVRKSSPIPIQRSSAPLDWSLALDDRLFSNGTRHSSQSYSNAMSGRDLESAVSLLRASSLCSKDTLLFMDHHRHMVRPRHHRSTGRSLIDEDDVIGPTNHSLWVSEGKVTIDREFYSC